MNESPISPEEREDSPHGANSLSSLSPEHNALTAVRRNIHLPLGGALLKGWTTEGRKLRELLEKKE